MDFQLRGRAIDNMQFDKTLKFLLFVKNASYSRSREHRTFTRERELTILRKHCSIKFSFPFAINSILSKKRLALLDSVRYDAFG